MVCCRHQLVEAHSKWLFGLLGSCGYTLVSDIKQAFKQAADECFGADSASALCGAGGFPKRMGNGSPVDAMSHNQFLDWLAHHQLVQLNPSQQHKLLQQWQKAACALVVDNKAKEQARRQGLIQSAEVDRMRQQMFQLQSQIDEHSAHCEQLDASHSRQIELLETERLQQIAQMHTK